MAKKVILVDDSRTILATAELALDPLISEGKIEVKMYDNPLNVVSEYLQGSGDFDLVICDVNMPQKNGLELIQELKADPRFSNKPMLMLTTESSAEMKAKGKEIGLTGWMVKPFSEDKLVKSVSMVLGI